MWSVPSPLNWFANVVETVLGHWLPFEKQQVWDKGFITISTSSREWGSRSLSFCFLIYKTKMIPILLPRIRKDWIEIIWRKIRKSCAKTGRIIIIPTANKPIYQSDILSIYQNGKLVINLLKCSSQQKCLHFPSLYNFHSG